MKWALRSGVSTLAFASIASAQTAPPGEPPAPAAPVAPAPATPAPVAPSAPPAATPPAAAPTAATPGPGPAVAPPPPSVSPEAAPPPQPAPAQAYPPAGATSAGAPPPGPQPYRGAAQPGGDDDEEQEHEGAFGRFDVGLGYGWVGAGDLAPEPGFKPIDNLSFSGPVLGATLEFGAGDSDFALAGELMYERMLTRLEQPSNVSFQLFGVGIAAAYYLADDFHLGAQLRYVGLLMWRRQIPCFWDQGDWTWGPGIGLTFGKEWFGDDDSGLGLALQGNYAVLTGDPDLSYASLLGKFTMTGF